MWLAVDLANSYSGQRLEASLDNDSSSSRLATLEVGDNGSGQVIATWAEAGASRPVGPMTLSLTRSRGVWPFEQTQVVLRGTSAPMNGCQYVFVSAIPV
jgi:hypothetical protein